MQALGFCQREQIVDIISGLPAVLALISVSYEYDTNLSSERRSTGNHN